MAGNGRANGEREKKKKIEVLRKYLSATSQRSDALQEELRRSNIVLYSFIPINTEANTLKEEILKTLDKYIPNLDLSCYDVKDVFRICSGPVVLKLSSAEIRGIILRSNAQLEK